MEMATKRDIALTLCLLLHLLAVGQQRKTAQLQVVEAGSDALRVEYRGGSLGVEADGERFVRVEMPGLAAAGHQPGSPALPVASRLVRLPAGSRLEVERLEADSLPRRLPLPKGLLALPALPPYPKDSLPPAPRVDSMRYASAASYRGGSLIEVENLGTMGGEQLFRIVVRPIDYRPLEGSLGEVAALTATLRIRRPTKSPAGSSDAMRYLIVSRPQFREGLQPFVDWKRQEGYDVAELYANTHQRDSIKELIRPYFTSAVEPMPRYLLIVGDAAQVQSFIGTTSINNETHITDLYYAEFTGDYLPEALVGRWPVNDTAELRAVVEKTLRYEQCRALDTQALRRLLLVAGAEQTPPAPTTTNGQVNYLRHEAKRRLPEVDTLCYHNPQSATQRDDILADLGSGVALLNYTAHCTVGGWSNPAVDASDVAAAGATQPTVVVNNCCKSNDFGGTGFGEQLLRQPEGGAVGVVGATNSTLWEEDHYWAVGPKTPLSLTPAYDSLCPGAFDPLLAASGEGCTMGELLAAGNMAVSALGTLYDKFYWEIYCLLGDPSLRPYLGVPRPADLWLMEAPVNGQDTLHLEGTPGARLTAMQGGQLIGSATAGADGRASMPLRQQLDMSPLILTATGFGLCPKVDTASVAEATTDGVALREVAVGDSAVSCWVENIGPSALVGLRITLEQQAEDSLAGGLIARQEQPIDTLQPGERVEARLPVVAEAIGPQPLWQARLVAGNGQAQAMRILRHSLPTTYPSLTLRLLNADGTEARRIMPRTAYRVVAEVEGEIDSVSLGVIANPRGLLAETADTTLRFTTPDSLCRLGLRYRVHRGNWHSESLRWMEPGLPADGFEAGMEAHPWRNQSRMPWTIDSTVSHSGRCSIRSGGIGHGQLTDLCLEVMLPHRDTVSYWVKTSTEDRYDKLTFSVDGVRRDPESWGEGDWRQYSHVVGAGRHTLRWRYSKDQSRSAGSDCVWLDDIRLPLSLWDTAMAWECAVATVGISAAEREVPRLEVTPNPANGQVWLRSTETMQVVIYDALGREKARLMVRAGEPCRQEVQGWAAGVYVVAGQTDSIHTFTKLMIGKN